MSDKSLIDAIKHYQKDIERSPGNAERMLRCLKRLYVMPIKVEHLQQTGVGRSVNNLREASGEVGDAATALVAKWKAMVTAEDMVQEEESPVEEEEEIPAEKSQTNTRVSPDNDRSVKDKENIRLNHRNDKVNESSERTEKSDKSYKRSDKDSKDNKSSKHSSKDRESSSRNDSSSRNHVSSKESSRDKDKKNKERSSEKNKESSKSEHKSSSEKHKESSKSEHKSSSEKHRESSKSEHKSSSEKDKKHRDDRDKNDSKDKHSSRDKEVSKEKDRKYSSSSSKDKHKDIVSLSRGRESSKKDKSSDRSRDHKEKNSKKESKRSRSHDREKESRKSEKRKHRDKDREDDKSNKRIKRERSSSDEEDESDAGSNESSSRVSDSDNENNHSSGDERTDHSDDEGSQSESEDASESESYSKVRIKQEPMSDSESEEESLPKKSSHKVSNHRSSSCSKSSKHKSNEEMRPPKTDDLKALIKENEKKVKKEKVEDGKNEKTKKSKTKIELNQDGSIDSGSGASFADALLGFDKTSSGSPKKKKKKEEGKPKDSISRLSTASLAASNMSGHSRSPSQCSTSSYRSTSSPTKQERKLSIQDIKDAPAALLKKPVKLEPLSLDISSTLPEISTNYKPLPSIQSRHTPTQVMSEEQMFNIMTSKNQRTKVYSGYKYGQIMAVPSLYSFCIQVLYDNIDCLEYTGGVPYEILKPLLIKLNAEQLSSLEHFNPYLVVDTDDLWKFHCKKTFPKGHRDDMESWREVYLRCMDERELKLKKLTANITESMATKGPKRQAKLAYVDSVVKPPRSVARQQVKYGTGTGSSSPAASTSSSNISQAAAVQNQAKKKEIVSKAVVGGFTPATQATEQVPGFSNPSAAAKILKKKKAPLMAKALQLIKGNRFKR